ncbi:MAG: hypothetical protein ABIK68_18465 [bacterium]
MSEHLKPWKIDLDRYPGETLSRVADICGAILSVLNGLENAMRQFHPPILPKIQQAIQPFERRLKKARLRFEPVVSAAGGDVLCDQLLKAADAALRCLDTFLGADQPQTAIGQVMKAMRQHYRAQACLYPLIDGLKPVGRYFLELPVRERLMDFAPALQNEASTGVFLDQGDESMGDYCFYIPETYDGTGDWPLVVALHGGSGRGKDMLWLWLREARSRRFLLVAPSSAGRTWSFEDSSDADRILAIIDSLSGQWRVDRSRILLTGFSDGAIYTLTCGLQQHAPYSALAPISGVLHPIDLAFAARKRIYLVHGELDWMFSIHHAHRSFARLRQAGAEIEFHAIPDLSHTYPREQNASILTWFDPALK